MKIQIVATALLVAGLVASPALATDTDQPQPLPPMSGEQVAFFTTWAGCQHLARARMSDETITVVSHLTNGELQTTSHTECDLE